LGAAQIRPFRSPEKRQLVRETEVPMFRKTTRWIPISALLLALIWRPSANYQILLHFLVCAGALVMVILALFFIKHEIEAHDTVDNSPNPARRVTVRL
jgi:hypothetical protein